MPKTSCQCGARYRFDQSAVGKRAKCKKCGKVFTIEPDEPPDDGIIPLADDGPDFAREAAARAAQAQSAIAASATTTAPQGRIYAPGGSPAAASPGFDAPGPRTIAGSRFLTDVVWTFLFPSSPANLVTFIAVWVALVMLAVLGIVPIIGWLLSLAVAAWYCAFRLEVLTSAAAGEEELPDVKLSENILADLIDPFVTWIGSWIVVFLPAIAFLVTQLNNGTITPLEFFAILFGGVEGFLSGGGTIIPMYDVLVYLGLFFWPMVILCVALGGFTTLARLDLIILTILKTFPLYLLTLGLMALAVFLQQKLMTVAATRAIGTGPASFGSLLGSSMILLVIGTGVGLYLDIVLMRLIGLYYHHFKGRFAWDWG